MAAAPLAEPLKKSGCWRMKSLQPPGLSAASPRPFSAMVEVASRSMKSRSWLTRISVPS